MKERLRRLRIGEREFRWSGQIGFLGYVPDERRCVYLKVWGGGRQIDPLTVTMVSNPASPGPWGAATDDSYPTPREVRAIVDLALAQGWDPLAPGGAFGVTAELDGWELHSPTERATAPRG